MRFNISTNNTGRLFESPVLFVDNLSPGLTQSTISFLVAEK